MAAGYMNSAQSVHLLSVLQLLKLSNINSKKTDLADMYIIVFGKSTCFIIIGVLHGCQVS